MIRMQFVAQWLPEWGKPRQATSIGESAPSGFFIFPMSAVELKALTGIQRRTAEGPRGGDIAIQRRHDTARSREIGHYLRDGLLVSGGRDRTAIGGHVDSLQMPGWLPTSIVVNILTPTDLRNHGQTLHEADAITIVVDNDTPYLRLPSSFKNRNWSPKAGHLHPMEVIDGQHRLWAFDEDASIPTTFQLPVVAYFSLKIRYQAYLFWSINVKPKRISPSLAYDLYPILRKDEWLASQADLQVFRDARAQELVEALWQHPKSVFFQRINMLGEPGRGDVTQAAWIRALTTTFIRRYSGHGRIRLGGLFGAEREDEPHLPWSRPQQAAFLIELFRSLFETIISQSPGWLMSLANYGHETNRKVTIHDIFSRHSLLRQDQGIRPTLHVYNDVFSVAEEHLSLSSIFDKAGREFEASDEDKIDIAIDLIRSNAPLLDFIGGINEVLATYDWRAASFPALTDEQRREKQALRGSGGYRVLRLDLLRLLVKKGLPGTRQFARKALAIADPE